MSEKLNVLICDDDSALNDILSIRLSPYFNIFTSTNVESTEIMLDSIKFDIALLDINYSESSKTGATLQDIFSRRSPHTSIIIHSGDSNINRILPVTKRKHAAFFLKGTTPFSEILSTLKKIEKIKIAEQMQIKEHFVTFSPVMKNIINKIDTILEKNNQEPILIYGESGVGKEHLVKYIAQKLRIKNVVSENMSCIPESLAESKLFGHCKGSFTGATEHSIGLFEQANNGIIFMDEIGEASLSTQVKLLRVLQEKEITRVGENKSRRIDVRFISGTHRKLEEMVKDKSFREDLLFRLNPLTLNLPPLRERKEDIILLASEFLDILNSRLPPHERYTFHDDAEEALLNYEWPGNIRELKSFISTIDVELPTKYVITKNDINNILLGRKLKTVNVVSQKINKHHSIKAKLEKTLNDCSGNVAKAASILHMNRATLYKKIKLYNIQKDYPIGLTPILN